MLIKFYSLPYPHSSLHSYEVIVYPSRSDSWIIHYCHSSSVFTLTDLRVATFFLNHEQCKGMHKSRALSSLPPSFLSAPLFLCLCGTPYILLTLALALVHSFSERTIA